MCLFIAKKDGMSKQLFLFTITRSEENHDLTVKTNYKHTFEIFYLSYSDSDNYLSISLFGLRLLETVVRLCETHDLGLGLIKNLLVEI